MIVRMRHGIGPILGLLLLASTAAALPQPTGRIGSYQYPTASSFGNLTAFYSDGSLLLAGLVPGGGGSDLLVARWTSTFTTATWAKTYDWMFMGDVPRGMAMNGDTAYIVGGSSTGKYLCRINSDGSLGWSTMPNVTGDVYDVAVDPTDSTIWVVGYDNAAPFMAVVLHYVDVGGTTCTQLGRYSFSYAAGADVQAYAIAVTSDRVWVGGTTYDVGPMVWKPWIAALNRTNPASIVLSNRTDDMIYRSVIYRLAAGQGHLFGWHIRDQGAGLAMAGRVVGVDMNDASFTQSPDFFGGTGPTLMGNYHCGLAFHPELPFLIAGGGGTLKGFNFDLTTAWSVTGVSPDSPAIGGVAVKGGLAYRVGVAFTAGGAAVEHANLSDYGFSSDMLQAAGTSHLIVAPNVLDLTAPDAEITFVVRPGLTGAGPFTLKVFDRTGNLLYSTDITLSAEGRAEVKWDGYMETGRRIGPGAYIAMLSGGSATKTERMPFVVKGRVQ